MKLYIFWLLHQTTTYWLPLPLHKSCISFDSYIKPQRALYKVCYNNVVYLLTPTSNHNHLVIIKRVYLLYIFWLLHQTTTVAMPSKLLLGCISFDSYIKPQLLVVLVLNKEVVYLLTPTSNHNTLSAKSIKESVVYLLTPTSNHNKTLVINLPSPVVYLLTPTSNHNRVFLQIWLMRLYIFWLLHQTTTHR